MRASDAARRDFFRRLLGPLWLRPESALWYGHMLAEAGRLMCDSLPQPSLEFGCMDGVNSFILLGGEFSTSFDVFSETTWSSESCHYDPGKPDFFDVSDVAPWGANERARYISKYPSHRFSLGVDWKQSHIRKADRLKVYEELRLLDLSGDYREIPKNHFNFIWAPNIYWMTDVRCVVEALARALRPGGRLVTICPDYSQLSSMWFARSEGIPDTVFRQWFTDLDRGRYANSKKTARPLKDWHALFQESNLEVFSHTDFIPSPVGKVYDIGLRPLFPALLDLHHRIQPLGEEKMLGFKASWLKVVFDAVSPLCDRSWLDDSSGGDLWHIFELGKR